MKRVTTKQSGFTLVEMLVVLSLLALATAVSLPYARASMEARRFEATTLDITLFLRNAQVAALAGSREVEVSYNIKSRQFGSTAVTRPIVVPDDITMNFLTIEGRVKSANAGFLFFATGGNSGGKIDLKRGQETKSIKLNWLTGAITTSMGNASP
jgi:general secretion pathway protein H